MAVQWILVVSLFIQLSNSCSEINCCNQCITTMCAWVQPWKAAARCCDLSSTCSAFIVHEVQPGQSCLYPGADPGICDRTTTPKPSQDVEYNWSLIVLFGLLIALILIAVVWWKFRDCLFRGASRASHLILSAIRRIICNYQNAGVADVEAVDPEAVQAEEDVAALQNDPDIPPEENLIHLSQETLSEDHEETLDDQRPPDHDISEEEEERVEEKQLIPKKHPMKLRDRK